MNELKAKGVEFTTPIEDQGFGLVTFFKAPGELVLQLDQPNYAKCDSNCPSPCA